MIPSEIGASTSFRYLNRAMRSGFREIRALWAWRRGGMPIPPPPEVKQRTVKAYRKRFSIDILVETGTYLGDMVEAGREAFRRIISIELDPDLWARARQRFSADDRITIVRGDSGAVLQHVLDDIDRPCLFWLDGHYSAGATARGPLETPILQELGHIFDHPIAGHVILVDDARCFTGEGDYPTLQHLRDFALDRRPGWTFDVAADIVRIHPPTRARKCFLHPRRPPRNGNRTGASQTAAGSVADRGVGPA